MKNFVFIIIFLSSIATAIAQDHFTYFCGQVAARELLFRGNHEAEAIARINREELEAFTAANSADRGGNDQLYTIPVVFHIIHQGGDENISDAQIQDAIAILTRDFRKQNADTSAIVDDFVSIAADCLIDFKLATKDPDGNCHPGINRISSPLTTDGYNPDMKALSYWPRNHYLNVWVCAVIGDNTAGFTNLPGDVASNWAASEDGIVMRSDYIGSIGTSSSGRSRTLTHEVGHWLNLYHTWGASNSPGDAANCDMDDLVTDTPNTIGYTSCSLNGSSCSTAIDNVQNYMEYSYCSRMFTWGQRQRMRAALASGTAQRNQLWANQNLINTGVNNPPLCLANFTTTRRSACVGDTIQFTDLSYNGVTSWDWNFGDNSTLVGIDPLVHKNPFHAYTDPGTYSISLEVSNGTDQVSATLNSFITIFDTASIAAPFVEGFEGTWPGNNWVGLNVDGDETWEITPSAHFSGTKSLKLRNYSIDAGLNDELYTATFDMTGADTVYASYKWAYANKTTTTDDKLRISVSGDCGNSWVVRKIRKGTTNLPTAAATNSQFTPASESDWDGEILELINPEWYNDRFRLKFEFNSLGGNNFYLDDINIYASDATTGIRLAEPLFIYNVYPNPSAGNMTLELGQINNERLTIELYNATGQLCSLLHDGILASGRHYITIPDQAPGLYNIVLKKPGHMAVQKVIFE